jgi:antitoxin component YwqK of YwqJK toxin-antitoxin module
MLAKLSLFILLISLNGEIYAQHRPVQSVNSSNIIKISIPNKKIFTGSSSNTLQIRSEGTIEGKLNGKRIFLSTVTKNKLNGKWVSYHTNGQILDSGYLVKGIPNGIWKVWDSDGNLLKIREYDADLYERIMADIKLNHPRYVKFAITTRYKKEGNEILKHLTSSYFFEGADISQYEKLEDLVKDNSANIQSYHPAFISCAHSGEYVNFSEQGLIRDSGYYRNGLKEGYWIHSDPSNTFIEKGSYKNGFKIDIWKKQDQSGKLISMKYYNQEGILQWEKQR